MWALALLLVATLYSRTAGHVFSMGYLTGAQRRPGDQEYNRPGLVVSGAISLAVSEVNNGELGRRGHSLSFTVAETYGEEVTSIRQTASLWTRNISAYIGPQETCVHEGRMAAAFNLPMISYFCTDYETSDKRNFPTFARTRPPDTQISKYVVSVLLAFNWTQVSFFYLNDSFHEKIASTILASLDSAGVKVQFQQSWVMPYHHGYMDNPFFKLVHDTFKDTRIYIILGYHYEHLGLMVAMEELKLFDNGEYWVVGVDIEQYDQDNPRKYFHGLLRDDVDEVAERAFRNYLSVVASSPVGFENFTLLVNSYMEKPPFNFPNPLELFGGVKQIRAEAAYLYDAVHLYARALLAVMDAGDDPRNGTAIVDAVRDCHYHSAMGYEVYMDENGDAEGNYTLLARQRHHFLPGGFGLYPAGIFTRRENGSRIPELHLTASIDWVNGKPPISQPPCGFRGEKCITHTGEIVAGIAGGVLIILAVVSLVLYRNWRYEQELDSLLWKVDFKDIQVNDDNRQSALGTKISRAIHPLIRTSQVSLSSNPDADFRYSTIYTQIGIYKGRVFTVKKVHKKSIDITRDMKKELKMMRDLRHDNLNSFIGACTDPPNICIVTEYCTRGSLKDILENEDVKLDNMFIASLVGDIIRGMMYLHDSHVKVHGNLKASNCLVDSRWVVKISDFGLHQFKHYDCVDELNCSLYPEDLSDALKRKYEGLLYRSPELLRSPPLALRGTQKGDVYSFGIILYELHARNGPFGLTPPGAGAVGLEDTSWAAETVRRVAYPEPGKPPHRPPLELLEHSFDFVRDCLVECWAENPEERPDFKTVRTKLRPMRKGMKPNIFDNMMAMMEKYANNLEALVDERTDQLTEEKKKTEALLYEMLPRYVAEQLKRGHKVEAESFDCVTIYFSDIVGFTAMSAESTPLQVVDFLNDLYTCFDSTIENYDVYKVETIGDAYMVVSGLPIRNGAQHAGEIASMSLHLLEAVKRFRVRHRPNDNLMLRVGLHCGPVCAGVVGLKMPRYCLFGDTVNTASRMESTGAPLKIHCSLECKSLLDKLGGYNLVERGMVRMKGKGDKLTYWLVGEDSVKRSARSEERFQRRAEASGKPRPVSNHDSNGCPGVPRSSLKTKTTANCFLARSPLARCSSLESPKRLRFASGNLLQFHPYQQQRCVSKDPLLEVIADNSPCKKPSNGRLTTPDITADCPNNDLRSANSCPCIEKCCSSTCSATFLKKQCSFVARFQDKNNSVPVLFPTTGVDSVVLHETSFASSAPTSPCSDSLTPELTLSLKNGTDNTLAYVGSDDDVHEPLLTTLSFIARGDGQEIETPV